ncbi:MAG: ABC transporter permease [Desulfobacteraceae bacterium]|nr:MAG: ABC transporter permease [Desulfobacteraceae bacterium]
MLVNLISRIGYRGIRNIISVGRMTLFFLSGVKNCFVYPFQLPKILDHTWFIGAKSIVVIILTALFTGMVLGLQGYYSLVKVGSEAALGSVVALSLVRELGPVFTAIMITARAGSAMAAEIGVMRISEQVDALVTMDIHPVRFIFSPRIVAAVISFPLLTALFDVIGIFGGYFTGSIMLGVEGGIYMDHVISSVEIFDINGGFIKAIVFSLVVTATCCYRGFYTHLQGHEAIGARGVSMSTTNAVVQSCVLILISDFIITYFLV